VKTGLKSIDNKIEVNPGQIIVLASRPSMGKSRLLKRIAINLAERGKTVQVLDLQNSIRESFLTMLCLLAGIERNKLREEWQVGDESMFQSVQRDNENGNINGEEFQCLVAAVNRATDLPLDIIDSQTSSTAEDLIAKDFDFTDKSYKHPDVIIIDNIQMLTRHKSKSDIDQFTSCLKAKAVNENTVIIVASDLSREVELRAWSMAHLSQLPSAMSSLDCVADKVIFLQRPEVYDPLDRQGYAELAIVKNRQGDCGSIKLRFCEVLGDFESFD